MQRKSQQIQEHFDSSMIVLTGAWLKKIKKCAPALDITLQEKLAVLNTELEKQFAHTAYKIRGINHFLHTKLDDLAGNSRTSLRAGLAIALITELTKIPFGPARGVAVDADNYNQAITAHIEKIWKSAGISDTTLLQKGREEARQAISEDPALKNKKIELIESIKKIIQAYKKSNKASIKHNFLEALQSIESKVKATTGMEIYASFNTDLQNAVNTLSDAENNYYKNRSMRFCFFPNAQKNSSLQPLIDQIQVAIPVQTIPPRSPKLI